MGFISRGKMLINGSTYPSDSKNNFRFAGINDFSKGNRSVRYKHYEELSDDVLRLRSIIKAHKEVENSGKMRLFEAMPKITTALLGISVAISQPGQIAKKAGAGLGFLAITGALTQVFDKISSHIQNKNKYNKNNDDKKGNIIKNIALTSLFAGVSVLSLVAFKKTNNFSKTREFLQKEFKQLTDEINSSKVGKFYDDKVNSFFLKHKKMGKAIKTIMPVASVVTTLGATVGLADSLSGDISEKAKYNYSKAKEIQKIAREEYNSIEAEEV